MVHASLPCKTWSTQAIARHRPGGVLDGPRISAEARDANAVVRHVIEELRYLKRVCPNAIITVENPATGYLQYFEPWQAAICELGLQRASQDQIGPGSGVPRQGTNSANLAPSVQA